MSTPRSHAGFEQQQIADEEFVRNALREERDRWRKSHEGSDHGFQADVARRLKVTPAHISQVVNTNKGVGPKLAFAFASWLGWGPDWHAKALAWWEANGRPGDVKATPPAQVAQADRYYESSHLRADSLCATLIRLGRLAPEKREEFRPILIGQLGHASDGTLTLDQERTAVARAFDLLARQDEAFAGPHPPTTPPEAGRLPEESPVRKPRGKIEPKKPKRR